MTIFSQLNRALVNILFIDHPPSIPIPSRPLCFSIILSAWRTVCIGSIHQTLQLSLNLLPSKFIHCSFSDSCQSRPIKAYRMTRETARQTGIAIHLPIIQFLSTFRLSDLSLPQKKVFSDQPAKMSKRSDITGMSLSTSWYYLSFWTSQCHFQVERMVGMKNLGSQIP